MPTLHILILHRPPPPHHHHKKEHKNGHKSHHHHQDDSDSYSDEDIPYNSSNDNLNGSPYQSSDMQQSSLGNQSGSLPGVNSIWSIFR